MKKGLLFIGVFAVSLHISTFGYATDASVSDLSRRMSQLEAQVLKLNGRLEEVTHALRQAEKKVTQVESDAVHRNVSHSTAEPSLSPFSTFSEEPSSNAEASLVSGGGAAEEPALAAEAVLPNGNAQDLYSQAQTFLTRGDYGAAERSLVDFLERFKEDPLRLNAQYWLGEAYFVRGEYEKSAVSFGEAYQTYLAYKKEQGSKAMDAQRIAKAPHTLAKLALSFKGLNRPEDVKRTIAQFDKEFPIAPKTVYRLTERACKGVDCTRSAVG
ncbi:MAG: tetratricopeptide repeat protein [bacterium]|nr:tetratricopeptide repeat protein [bacterium]